MYGCMGCTTRALGWPSTSKRIKAFHGHTAVYIQVYIPANPNPGDIARLTSTFVAFLCHSRLCVIRAHRALQFSKADRRFSNRIGRPPLSPQLSPPRGPAAVPAAGRHNAARHGTPYQHGNEQEMSKCRLPSTLWVGGPQFLEEFSHLKMDLLFRWIRPSLDGRASLDGGPTAS